jgi:hypothetical protein
MSEQEDRLHAVNQARSLLEAVGQTNNFELPAAVRNTAVAALLGYPSQIGATVVLEEAGELAVAMWARALAQTRWVMEEVLKRLEPGDPLSEQAAAVERHFPRAAYLPRLVYGGLQTWKDFLLEPAGESDAIVQSVEVGGEECDLDIQVLGRPWSPDEMARYGNLPGHLEMVDGKLCLDDGQRMLLLGALLEHVGTARAVSLGRLASWVTAVEQRKEDQAWDEMPAVGAERFWLPEHMPFRKKLQLKGLVKTRRRRVERNCGRST